MMFVVVGLMLLFVCIQLLNVIITVVRGFDQPEQKLTDEELPEISVLVAARNEEQNIAACIQHLLAQNYPKHKLHIFIGNDQSDDNTAKIVDEFVAQHHNIKQIHITKQLGKARGKANVLAQLTHVAKGNYFLITDADIQVSANWVRILINFFKPGVGIVSGTTIVKGKGFLANMQHIDWLYFMGLLLSFNRMQIRSTAVGNNMAITKAAYESTGGYENMDFSVTEDYKLFQQVRKKGYQTINMIHPDAINISAAAADVNTLLNQRKRWLTGAMELPFYWWIIFAVYGSFWLALGCCFFIDVKLAGAFLAAKFLIQSLTIYWQQKQLGIQTKLLHLLWYEVYTLGLTLLTIFYFVIPKKLNWKNRYY
jgi:cellulose synthase/poly-beta-1,6-N-acetylglucosamine synthase-like glycosyltransferase